MEAPSWDIDEVCDVRRVTLLETKDFEMSEDISDVDEAPFAGEQNGDSCQEVPPNFSRKKQRNLKYRPLCPILVVRVMSCKKHGKNIGSFRFHKACELKQLLFLSNRTNLEKKRILDYSKPPNFSKVSSQRD